MNLKNLHAFWLFYLVARERSFTKAAAIANMSQPPLSMQIRSLEEKLGKPLIDRTFHKVTLTKEGKRLYPLVEQFLDLTEEFFSEVQEAMTGKSRKFVIGTFSWAIQLLAAPIIRELSQCYPNDRFDFLEIESINVPSLLKNYQVDVGYAYAEPLENSGLITETAAEIECVCVVSKHHPLARRKKLRMQQLNGETCVCISSDVSPDLYRIMDSLALQHSFGIKTKRTIRTFFAQSAHVGMGEGFMLLARPAAALLPDSLASVLIEDAPSLNLMRICRREVHGDVFEDLKRLERKYLQGLPGVVLS